MDEDELNLTIEFKLELDKLLFSDTRYVNDDKTKILIQDKADEFIKNKIDSGDLLGDFIFEFGADNNSSDLAIGFRKKF